MKTKIDIYDFFTGIINQAYNSPNIQYEEYCRFVPDGVPKLMYNKFLEDSFILECEIIYVWLIDYIHKNNISIDFEKLSETEAKILSSLYFKHFSNLNYSVEKIKQETYNITLKHDEVHFAFWNTDLFITEENKMEAFCGFYCRYIFDKYRVDKTDANLINELSYLVFMKAATVEHAIEECLKQLEIKK